MRKLFSILAAVLVSVAMQAKVMTTNIYGGSLLLIADGNEFQPRNESFFAVGQTLRLTFERSNEYGWMQAYHKDGAPNWHGTNILEDIDLSTGVVEVVLSETAVVQIRANGGLYIKGNDVTLKSIDLIYDDGVEPEKDATVIWEGEVTAPKDQVSSETTIKAPNFSTAKAGDIVRFTFSNVEGANYYQMSVRTQNDNWQTSHQYLSYTGVTAPTAEITLLADDLEDLKAHGLFFFGKNVTITKAELLQHACIAGELWTGTLTSEIGNIEINKSSFFTVVAGDKLRFTFENTRNTYQQLSVWVKNENDENQYYMNYGGVDGESQIFTLELPNDPKLDYLKQKGLFVSCKNVDLTKVELLREKATESVTIVDNTNSGLLLKNIKNDIVDITISRTLYRDGYFNTLCLPFDLSAEQIAASELSSAEIMEFTNAYISGEGDEQTLDLRFDPVSQIEAGKPYLIRFANTNDQLDALSFYNVIVTKEPSEELTVEGASMNFVGIFAPKALNSANNLFLGTNDELYWVNAADGTSLQGFRAYFTCDAGGPVSVPARIVTRGNIVTDIEEIPATQTQSQKLMRNGQLFIIRDGKIYNVLGQTINE